MSRPVIITCAPTGGTHAPTMSGYLPITLGEIADAGIGSYGDKLMYIHTIAKKLFGDEYERSVRAAGRHQMMFTTQAAMLGGNVRVGLEDSLYIGPGEKAKSNAEQVTKIRSIIENLGKTIATPEEARKRLGLKGADKVAF